MSFLIIAHRGVISADDGSSSQRIKQCWHLNMVLKESVDMEINTLIWFCYMTEEQPDER